MPGAPVFLFFYFCSLDRTRAYLLPALRRTRRRTSHEHNSSSRHIEEVRPKAVNDFRFLCLILCGCHFIPVIAVAPLFFRTVCRKLSNPKVAPSHTPPPPLARLDKVVFFPFSYLVPCGARSSDHSANGSSFPSSTQMSMHVLTGQELERDWGK